MIIAASFDKLLYPVLFLHFRLLFLLLSPLAFAVWGAAAPALAAPWLPVFICQHFLCSDCYQSLSRNSSCQRTMALSPQLCAV